MQKFQKGDLVQIAADLGFERRHFTAGARAIVLGSYRDCYGGTVKNEGDYQLFIEAQGPSAWYRDSDLTLIAPRQLEILDYWRDGAFMSNGRTDEVLRRLAIDHSNPPPLREELQILRDWRDSVVARAVLAGMKKGEGLCSWFEKLASEIKASR